jgi:hypothetical protein
VDEDAFGQEVARFLLPMPVRRMDELAGYLEHAYGEGLVMHQEDRWLVVNRPRTAPR